MIRLIAAFLLLLWPQALLAQDRVVPLSAADARIALGPDLRFLPPADARRIVVDLWENPSTEADDILGMIVPESADAKSPEWGAVIRWEPIGHVAADTAREADYDALMDEMQAQVRAQNDKRREDGYTPVQLLGWAERPSYDSVSNTVTWARELRFFDGGENTLHYNVRILGRYGVLSMNIVAPMDRLAEVSTVAKQLSERTEFVPGARYADFDAERDEVAGYGVAGLVATGVGVAVAKNAGVFAVIAKLLQPLGIALLVLAAALAVPFRRWFGTKDRAVKR
ncbi:DUF2167 domain-containing protein [Aurantiacibacter aquimixticola]|uniref:DUF2167 domain-containing protein n=1 Tax=Aurantiacibacter aquimixticola TaxID=1958945 RepID=A0A419RRW9_9SPHN|nr:DUF2167 domain-containing protein [Aurantiacibacter aquimixticola]RJY08525.1 DUF2167 domain-containing protein [Aurantiacibacter aquimixticola]